MLTLRRTAALVLSFVLLPTLVVTAGAAPSGAAPSPDRPLFRALDGFHLPSAELTARPRQFSAYRVELAGVRAALAGSGTQTLAVPAPTGETVAFTVAEDSVMEPQLQAAHPDIRTYAGRSADGSSVRLDVTPLGLHAFVRQLDGRAWYVDPVQVRAGEDRVVSYFGAAVPPAAEAFVEHDLLDPAGASAVGDDQAFGAPGGTVSTRTYDLAFLTDPTYADHFAGEATDPAVIDGLVLAAKTTLVNRVNEVYNDDLAIKFVLINGTDTELNLATVAEATGPNGPCGASPCFTSAQLASCSGSTLDRNEFVLGMLVGADNFDIGHIGLGVNGGGIAGLGVVGGPFKADGCTGLPEPDGDFYGIDYVAHEMGHQMGGDHTFNGTQLNCSTGNRNVDPYTTQVEPGSGSSIMAYAGICQQDNLQPHSDPYFSFASVDQINATTSAAPGTVDEQQVVSFAGFDGADAFTISCAGCSTSAPIANGGLTYNKQTVADAVSTATGQTVTAAEVTDYDSGGFPFADPTSSPSPAGFTVDFALAGSGTPVPTLVIAPTTGTFTAKVGTVYNGGDETNQGVVAPAVPANKAPVVTAPADKTIPTRTPFTLTGSATDLDGEPLTYMWEQTDAGGAQGTGLVSNNKTDGPLFRQFGTAAQVSKTDSLTYHSPGENLAGSSPSRTFPDLAQVVAGNTNAKTGTCPAAPPAPASGGATNVPAATIDCYSEFLPTSSWMGNTTLAGRYPASPRVMHFRLTARDEFTPDAAADHAGGLASDEVALTVSSSAGPFLVTSRGSAGSPADAGATEAVTWAVAGTNTASLATNVSISLSIDGGATFPYVLAASTPNDGTQDVTLPDVTTAHARIKVEAVDNYFFAVNDADFTINGPLTVTTPASPTVQYSDALPPGVGATASSPSNDGDQLTATVSGLPGLSATRVSTSPDGDRPGTAQFGVSGVVSSPPGSYPVTLTVTDSAGPVAVTTFPVVVTPEDATVTYSGDRDVAASNGSAVVTLASTVGDIADSIRGNITGASVTFVNRATGANLCASPVSGGPLSGTASCRATLATGQYRVGTVVGGRYARDSASDDVVVRVGQAQGIDTRVAAGAVSDGFVLTRRLTITNSASQPASGFVCTFDGKSIPCGATATLKFKPGTHVYTAAAKDASGSVDATPAVLRFASPANDGQLKLATDGWTRHKDKSSYRGGYTEGSRRGLVMTKRGKNITAIALVVHTGKGFGKVAVFLGKNKLKTVKLAGKAHKAVLVPVATFGTPTKGLVRVVTLTGKPVRIDGLGILEG
jgi:hypothetical protein